MITYYTTDSNIFYVKTTDKVSAEDIKDYLKEFDNINFPIQDLVCLYDLRDAEIKLNFFQIVSIAKLTKKVTAKFKTVKTAFLVNKPNITAYSFLFDREASNSRTVRKIFSTEEAAFEWLGAKQQNKLSKSI